MRTILLFASLMMSPVGAMPPGHGPCPEATHLDDSLIERALVVVAQPIDPVRVVDFEEARDLYRCTPGARTLTSQSPRDLMAFRIVNDQRIFVNRQSAVYQDAVRRPTALALLKLAGILTHEQVHHSDGEYAASRLQADFVRSRLDRLSRRERVEASSYLQGLETRATALGRGARKARPASRAAATASGIPSSPGADRALALAPGARGHAVGLADR